MSDDYKWIRIGTLGCVSSPTSINQKHRCSILNVYTEFLPIGSDEIGWKTTDCDGNSITGVSFDIKQDKFGRDPTIWTRLTDDSTQSIQEKPNLYIANPQDTNQAFNVDWYALIPASPAPPLAS